VRVLCAAMMTYLPRCVSLCMHTHTPVRTVHRVLCGARFALIAPGRHATCGDSTASHFGSLIVIIIFVVYDIIS
jgi:hypothetical protein